MTGLMLADFLLPIGAAAIGIIGGLLLIALDDWILKHRKDKR